MLRVTDLAINGEHPCMFPLVLTNAPARPIGVPVHRTNVRGLRIDDPVHPTADPVRRTSVDRSLGCNGSARNE